MFRTLGEMGEVFMTKLEFYSFLEKNGLGFSISYHGYGSYDVMTSDREYISVKGYYFKGELFKTDCNIYIKNKITDKVINQLYSFSESPNECFDRFLRYLSDVEVVVIEYKNKQNERVYINLR